MQGAREAALKNRDGVYLIGAVKLVTQVSDHAEEHAERAIDADVAVNGAVQEVCLPLSREQPVANTHLPRARRHDDQRGTHVRGKTELTLGGAAGRCRDEARQTSE